MSGLGGDTDAAGPAIPFAVCGDGGRVLCVQLRLCHRANHPNSGKGQPEREYSEENPEKRTRNSPNQPDDR
jgi:hypothetical protein